MSRIDELADRYFRHIGAPWQPNLTGAERTTWLVYPKADERKVTFRLPLFEEKTVAAGHRWVSFDFTSVLHRWFSQLDPDHQLIYLEEPDSLHEELDLQGPQNSAITSTAIEAVEAALKESGVDENTVVALSGVGALFGFTRITSVLESIRKFTPGHLLVLFPGTCDGPQFRLFDTTDGSGYLGVAITPHSSLYDA